MAIVATCKATNTVPQHGTPQYADYTAVNPILDGIIEPAKKNLNVRLPGDPLPGVSHVEDAIAAWDLAGFNKPRTRRKASGESQPLRNLPEWTLLINWLPE